MKLMLLLIGMIMVLEGLPYAAAPEMMQAWLQKIGEMHPRELRIFGIIIVISGLALCWVVKSSGGI